MKDMAMAPDLPQPKLVAQSRAARSRRAVFFCVDDRYAPYALFLAQQIRAAFPVADFDLCLVSEKPLSPHPLMGAMNLRLVQIDVGDMAQLALIGDRLGLAAYLRAFMPRLWAGDYDRLLYLDADIFYQRGDIPALFDQDLGGAALAGVLDTKQWHKPGRAAADLKPFNLPFCPYFNTGVLLIDVAAYNAQNVGEDVLRLIAARGKDLAWHDQTALNVVVRGNWAQLPVQWNFQYSHKTMLLSAHFDVCFFHFIGRRKPFYARYGGFPRRFTDAYRAFLAQHFPHLAAQVRDGTGGPKHWAALALIFLFNLSMARGALRMEQTAHGDFDILAPQQIPPK